MMTRLILVLASVLIIPALAEASLADLVINEFLASNRTGLLDEDGDASDWIEIYNSGATTVNLQGVALTDDPAEPGQWTFPNVSIASHAYLIIFASGKDRKPTAGGTLHTNFQLGADGEYLGLYDAQSPRQVVMEYASQFPPQRSDYSYGLGAGGIRTYFETPTPGGANGSSAIFAGFVADPVFSVAHGLYSGELEVEVTSATPQAVIYYTLDGSEPTAQSGSLYAGPLDASGAPSKALVTLRAVAVRAGYLPSNVVSSTYVFPVHVLTQPGNPAGFPATWGNTTVTTADYEMDPDVTANPAYSARALQGLSSLPSLSVVLSVDDLFGRTRGIYSNPSLEGVAWERAASAELIYPDGREGFQVNCGLRIQGGSSTENWKSPKLSLRLLFKGDYGPSKLQFPLFGSSAVDRFNTLVLDAHLNLTWIHPDHGQRVRSQYVRDQFASDLQNAMGSLGPHGIFVNLYLNGLYWGVYGVHEKPDADFQEEYFGGDESEYDVLRHTGSEVVSGSSAAWNTMMGIARGGLSTDGQYQALQDYLNVDDLIDYMIVHLYVGNDDWPRHNWYTARRRVPGAGFRFFSWDSEHILKDRALNQTAVSDTNSPAELYDRLRRQNAEFRLLFADHVHRHFFNGGPLYVDPSSPAWDPAHPERNVPAAHYVRRIEEIDPSIILESARWGDYRRPTLPYTRDTEWAAELNWVLTQYFPQRSSIVLNQFRAINLYPALGAPFFNQHGGQIEPGFILTMGLPAGTTGTIYYTIDGEDPRVYGSGDVSESAATYGGPIMLRDHTRVKARVFDGAAWSALNEATFTVSSPAEALRITELLYNPLAGEDDEFIELRNVGPVTIGLDGVYFSEGIAFLFDPGTTLGPGQFVVLVSNAVAFAARHPGVPIGGVYSGNLSNGGEKVTLRDSAGNVIVSVDYDDEAFWPIAPDGFGYSLVIVDPAGNADDPANWRASAAVHGSPGASDPTPLHGGVVINEVLSRGAAPLEDAIELHNLGSTSMAIGGWYLSDNREDAAGLRRFRIPGGIDIPAGGYAVFYENQFNPTPGVPPSFELNENGGAAYLAAADGGGNLTGYVVGVEFDAAESGVSFGRHPTSTGQDFTAMSARTFGVDSPASVAEFRLGNGAPNALPKIPAVIINELDYHPELGGDEFIELYNTTGADISLHEPASGLGWRLNGILNQEEVARFEFETGTVIPARSFLLVVGIDPAVFRSRYAVPAFVPITGPYGGAVDNSGERLKLYRPVPPGGSDPAYILVDQVRFNDKAPWPTSPDGEGPSLERIFASSYGNEPVNWAASVPPGGTPGRENSVTDPGANQRPIAVFTVNPDPGGDPMTMVFDASQSYDPDGMVVRFDWDFGDGMTARGMNVPHTYGAAGAYLVRLVIADEGAAEGSSTRSITVEEPPPRGGMVPGDCNRDGRLDISDAVCLLNRLFVGPAAGLPCAGDSVSEGGNLPLLNANNDSRVDLSDAVHLLNYLFLRGPEHVLGATCAVIVDCPELCTP